MSFSEKETLGRLGDGESISSICEAAQLTRAQFDAFWREVVRRKAQTASEVTLSTANFGQATITRDDAGIPRIAAANDADLFFAYGWAMAEDRLFQLEWLRRRGQGRLSEILGMDGLETDSVARTVGLNRIAEAEWRRLDSEVKHLVEQFSAGINGYIEQCDDLPIEFDLLRHQPEPWSGVDSLAIECEFQWYLTGRLPVICMPELAKRRLGREPRLLKEYLLSEYDDESILHTGDYKPNVANARTLKTIGHSVADPDASTGSNNWVIAGARTQSGMPLVASDPHIALEAVSCWYQVHLCGGSFDVAGMTYVGMPAVMFGRNRHVAWGITNNICSQRDLYLERISSEHPGCFEFDGEWEPERKLTETINVRDSGPVEKTIRFSRNGPIVDEILPAPANELGPVSLRWLGMSHGGWLTSLLNMNRANTISDFRAALRPWHVPTFSMVMADTNGNIGFHASGRVPVRNDSNRAFRKGWDPTDQWRGLIPFDEMPSFQNPKRGWIVSANNRIAPNDFPHRMHGCWASGARAIRIREMIGDRNDLTTANMLEMQFDSKNLRAASVVPKLVERLASSFDEVTCLRETRALSILREWNFHSDPDLVAPSIFNVFYSEWCKTLSRARFEEGAEAELMSQGMDPSAGRLVSDDRYGWFRNGDHQEQLAATFTRALEILEQRLGRNINDWTWGKLHVMPLPHCLAHCGDLGELLEYGGLGVRGDMLTVCNTGCAPDWSAASGGGFRMVVDLAESPASIWTIDGQSQSGQPGSPHYNDQLEDWLAGKLRRQEL